jgi:cytochrome P450
VTNTAAAGIDLANPGAFVDGVPHEALAELRRTDPVHWQSMDGEPGFWAVLRHSDVAYVARHPEVFSASEGGVVVENLLPEHLAMMRNMLLAMDPPTHTAHRAGLLPHFRARVMAGIEDRVREICRAIMAEARERREVEFVHDVASRLPSRVVGQLFGLPSQDWDHMHELAERSTSSQDADLAGAEDTSAATIEMAMYAIGLAASRRQADDDSDDLTSAILRTEFGGQLMSDVDFGSFFVQLVIAGNDTTKAMLASGLLTLLRHPDQLAELRADRALIAGAVEEMIRYDNPFHYFRRTALVDTELAGARIAAGDKVAMYYTSANRDEHVFCEPQLFDIRRDPNPHLSFGIAGHFCLGVHLARLEGRVFFEELLDAFPKFELSGEPVRIRSNLTNGLKRLPIRLSA